ncbi:unnamed protein product [Pelagomonas calceolata]|uniref:Uncharacterized protein n=1 Tax=Pelagomonas calceolata TaxID=35677 RepID=A0A8J2WRJ2_9STRA|nr:unnamed protein product [Pelagomonas calceolata]|mmetsp:Transcript_11112/g.32850  ORF Transcript_11112/g.32850 Transcript_11112/m.32850 type:complete len:112 (-) Transcript_11112:23-358(-)
MRRVVLALIALVGYAEAFVAPQPTSAPLTVVAGRNDKRTKKGKVYAGSNGKSRPRKPGGEKGPVDPYLTLREWGARQDPAMSVEEVVAAKMADKRKVEITLEDIMDAVTPF